MERTASEGAVYLVHFLDTRTPEERTSLLRLLDVPRSDDAAQTMAYLRDHVMQANVAAAQAIITEFVQRAPPWGESDSECLQLQRDVVACSTELPRWTPRTAFVPFLLAQAFDQAQDRPPHVVIAAPFFEHVFGPVLHDQVDLAKNFSLAYERSRVLARWKMMAGGSLRAPATVTETRDQEGADQGPDAVGRLFRPTLVLSELGVSVESLRRVQRHIDNLRKELVRAKRDTPEALRYLEQVPTEFALSLSEAAYRLTQVRRTIAAMAREPGGNGLVRRRACVFSFGTAPLQHRFTAQLLRCFAWTDLALSGAVVASTLQYLQRLHAGCSPQLLDTHHRLTQRQWLTFAFVRVWRLPPPLPPGAHFVPDVVMPSGLVAQPPPSSPSEEAMVEGLSALSLQEQKKTKGQHVAGRFALTPQSVCLWVPSATLGPGATPVVTLAREVLPKDVRLLVGTEETLSCPHVVTALDRTPQAYHEAMQLADLLATLLPQQLETLLVLCPEREPEGNATLRWLETLGLLLAERLRNSGRPKARVSLEVVWRAGRNAAARAALELGLEWWHHGAETEPSVHVARFLAARFAPRVWQIQLLLPASVEPEVRMQLLEALADATHQRVTFRAGVPRAGSTLPLLVVTSPAEYRTRTERDEHKGPRVTLLVSCKGDAGATCSSSDPAVLCLCDLPRRRTPNGLLLPQLLERSCNRKALRQLRRALGVCE